MDRLVKALVLGMSLSVLMNTSAFAASDGSIGTTSTGTSTVSLTIPELIQITGMADFAFGSYSGTGNFDSNDNVTISGNDDQAGPEYQVTATGSGAGSAFTVGRTAPAAPAATIAYTVAFNDQTGTAGETGLATTVALTDQTGINDELSDVAANANIHVVFLQAALRAAPAGTYSGTLTVVVAPE
jgi:spore coat protein U-like protein